MDLNTNLIDQPALGLTTDLTQISTVGIVGEFGGRWAVTYGDLNGATNQTMLATFAETGATPSISRAATTIPYGAAGAAGCDASGCLYASTRSAQRFDASGTAVGAPITFGTPADGPASRAVTVATLRDQWESLVQLQRRAILTCTWRASRVTARFAIAPGCSTRPSARRVSRPRSRQMGRAFSRCFAPRWAAARACRGSTRIWSTCRRASRRGLPSRSRSAPT